MYRSGDLAKLEKDGSLRLIGRRDFQVKIRGHRVELQSIEGLLEEHAAVEKAIVVPWHRDSQGAELLAYLLFKKELSEYPQKLRALLASSLPEYMIPYMFIPIEKVPLNRSAKIDRGALPDPSSLIRNYSIKESKAAKASLVLEAFRCILERPELGPEDDFFHWGGHSALALKVAEILSKSMGKRILLEWIFELPRAADLEDYILINGESIEYSPLLSLKEGEVHDTLIFLPSKEGHVFPYLPLLKHLPREQRVWALQSPRLMEGSAGNVSIDDLTKECLEILVHTELPKSYILGDYGFRGCLARAIQEKMSPEKKPKALISIEGTDECSPLPHEHYRRVANELRSMRKDL